MNNINRVIVAGDDRTVTVVDEGTTEFGRKYMVTVSTLEGLERVLPEYYCGYVHAPELTGDEDWIDALEVHGGVTFSQEMGLYGVDEGIWLGFDCCHAGDFATDADLKPFLGTDAGVKSLEYVKEEVRRLAIDIQEHILFGTKKRALAAPPPEKQRGQLMSNKGGESMTEIKKVISRCVEEALDDPTSHSLCDLLSCSELSGGPIVLRFRPDGTELLGRVIVAAIHKDDLELEKVFDEASDRFDEIAKARGIHKINSSDGERIL